MNLAKRRALLVLLAAGALPGVLRHALAQQQIAQGMRQVRGDVRVNGQRAAAGTPVHPGDTVTTGKGGLALFVVGQDAFLMRQNSRAQFEGSEALVSVLRLVTGKLLGVFGSGRSRRLEVPTASIGIRGTGAYLEAGRRRSYFCLCYGTAEVAAAGSDARASYTTTHHESPRYIYGDGRRNAIVPARMANHTDAELIMAEKLVGRTPPPAFMQSPHRY